MSPDRSDLLVSFLLGIFDHNMHEMEIHIERVGYQGTRTVKILEVLEEMRAAGSADHIFKKIKEMHSNPAVENQLLMGRAIRHVLKQEKEAQRLEDIASVRLVRNKPGLDSPPAQEQELTSAEAKAIVEMSDDNFEDFLTELAHELASPYTEEAEKGATNENKRQPLSSPTREVLVEQCKKLAESIIKRLNPKGEFDPVKVAVKLAAIAIYQNAVAQKREQIEAEKKKEIEKKELKREMRKEEILKDQIKNAIVDALIEKWGVSKQDMSERDYARAYRLGEYLGKAVMNEILQGQRIARMVSEG